MKKFIYILPAVVCILLAAACSNKKVRTDKDAIEEIVAEFQENLPSNIGEGFILESIDYDPEAAVLKYTYIYDEHDVTVQEYITDLTDFITSDKKQLYTLIDRSEELIPLLADSGSSFDFEISGTVTGEVYGVTFENTHLREAREIKETPRDYLAEMKTAVAEVNEGYPYHEEGNPDWVTDSLALTDDYLVYYYTLNSNTYSSELMKAQRQGILEALRKDFNDNPGLSELMKELGLGLKCIYRFTDGAEVDFTYTDAQLFE